MITPPKTAEVGWKPLYILNGINSSVAQTLKPAGLENAKGIISDTSFKDPTNPKWQDDAGHKWWSAFMDKYFPDGDKTSSFTVYGYTVAQTLVQVLKQCGDNLTRENVMKQAANLKNLELGMLLPGIKINTSATDFYPLQAVRMGRVKGESFELFGEVLASTGPSQYLGRCGGCKRGLRVVATDGGELAVVIGRRTYRADRAAARAAVGGISAMNDVSGRRAQLETPLRQFTLGKSFDTFAPMGPSIAPADGIDMADIEVRTTVSGEVMQDANTCDLIFGVEDLIMYLSAGLTPEPGDVIATGTPGGVGDSRNPPRYLREGDTVEVFVSGVGTLSNQVTSER